LSPWFDLAVFTVRLCRRFLHRFGELFLFRQAYADKV
jgi:hypothetical protein